METEPPEKRARIGVSSETDPQVNNAVVVEAVPADDPNTNLLNLVFGIDMLREKIVNFVIHDKGKLSRANAHSCRLVQHSWHQSVSKCLRDAGEPLFELQLWREAHFEPTSLVNKFLQNYATSSRLLDSVPPFFLLVIFYDEVRETKPWDVLKRFFRYCSSGLLSLELLSYCQADVHKLDPYDGLSLPVLQKLNVYCFDVNKPALRQYTAMVHRIVSASRKLTFLRLKVHKMFPLSFSAFCLPATLTKLELLSGMSFDYLEQLATCNGVTFPKLTDLTLAIPYDAYDEQGSIYRILDRVRHTLKRLTLTGGEVRADSPDRRTKSIYLPTMGRLLFCSIPFS